MRLSEKDTIERIKARQRLFAKIQNILTLGYGTKEDLRELDKQLRDFYWDDLRQLRHRWEKAYMEALDAGQMSLNRGFKGVIQVMDRLSEEVQRADYGYAGFFDRKGHIREDELTKVFDYDRGFDEDVARLKEGVEKVYSNVKAKAWSAVSDEVDAVRGVLDGVETKWRDRERQFRSPEV
jgi:hypothetical protein